MRVNNNMIFDNNLINMQNTLQRLNEIQNQLTSNTKLSKPSDNPVDMNRYMRYKDLISRDEQYLKNIDVISPSLETTDGLLFSFSEQVNSIKTIMQQYLQATSDETTSANISNLENILNNFVDMGNTQFNGRYLFGGYNSTDKPFSIEDGKVRFNGSDEVFAAQVGQGQMVDATIKGTDLFPVAVLHSANYYSSPSEEIFPEATTNVFNLRVGEVETVVTVGAGTAELTLQDVVDAINVSGAEVKAYAENTDNGYRLKLVSKFVGEAGAISLTDTANNGILVRMGLVDNANNFVGTQKSADNSLIDKVLGLLNKMKAGDKDIETERAAIFQGGENIIKLHGRVGVMMQGLEFKKNFITDMITRNSSLVSSIEDIDYTELITQYNQEYLGYQAAVKVSSQIMLPTLLDYI